MNSDWRQDLRSALENAILDNDDDIDDIDAIFRPACRQPPQDNFFGFLGVESEGLIAAGATARVLSRPMLPFRPERLYVVEASKGCTILDIRYGTWSRFIGLGGVPAEAFTRCRKGHLYDLLANARDGNTVRIPPDLVSEIDQFGERLPTGKGGTLGVGMDLLTFVRNDGYAAVPFRAVYFGQGIE